MVSQSTTWTSAAEADGTTASSKAIATIKPRNGLMIPPLLLSPAGWQGPSSPYIQKVRVVPAIAVGLRERDAAMRVLDTVPMPLTTSRPSWIFASYCFPPYPV